MMWGYATAKLPRTLIVSLPERTTEDQTTRPDPNPRVKNISRIPERQSQTMTEYRAIIKYSTEGRTTVTLTSDWVPHRDIAEEVATAFEPPENKWGEVFETRIERKETEYTNQ